LATARNIILAGFMGSGKTTVGKILAQRLGWKFLDTDRLIEERSGAPVAEIFKQYGEAAFRDMETSLARELALFENCVIATGGGFMVRPENRDSAAKGGEIILLVASPMEIWHRVGQSRHRPLLQVEDPLARIQELLRARQPAYDAIAWQIQTDGRPATAIAEEIVEKLKV